MRKLPRLLKTTLVALALTGIGIGATECPSFYTFDGYTLVALEPGIDLEFRLRAALLTARPGTIIELPAGTYPVRRRLTVETDHIVIRGQGMYSTILDYSGQDQGSEGILARGDHFVIQDLAIMDPRGDGVKTEFVDGATYERVRVEWNHPDDTTHGDYGIYPAQNKNVLVSNCIVKGARDAAIYVGQSEQAIVRWSFVERSVIGIEIENSRFTEVYGNVARNNTSGIVVFELPNLQVDGTTTRVYDNLAISNNYPNFAPGGIIALIPPGVGYLVIGSDQVQFDNNEASDNKTSNMAISSYEISGENPAQDPTYDPYTEGVYVFDNRFSNGGYEPDGILGGLVLAQIFDLPLPDILVGGWVDGNKIAGGLQTDTDGLADPFHATLQVEAANRICLQNNTGIGGGPASFGNANAIAAPRPFEDARLLDVSAHDCTQPLLAPVVLDARPDPDPGDPPLTEEEVAELCGGGDGGVNWDAYIADCPNLSDWGLFADPSDPTANPNGGGFPFDLQMPLFSDYTTKHRFVFLPPGTSMQYSADGVFTFPEGTIIAKTFRFVASAHAEDSWVETRLLIKRPLGWEGLPYIANVAQTDAVLSIGGGDVDYTDPDGIDRVYVVPSTADCGSCHFGFGGDVPIGPKARLLNRDFDYGGGPTNQIDYLTAMGHLLGAPAAATIPTVPGLDGWDQAGADIDEVARVYLDINCAHCHNPVGRAGFTGMDLEYDADPFDTTYGICKMPVAAGSAADGLTYDIVPGDPAMSLLMRRSLSLEPEVKMPEIERNRVHEEGVAMLQAWVTQLPGDCVE